MAYKDLYVLAQDPQLWQRLAPAVAQVCVTVYGEDGQTANHAVRVALVTYAGPRLDDFKRFAQEIALLLLVLNPALSAGTADAQLVTAIEQMWTAYALIMQSKGVIAA